MPDFNSENCPTSSELLEYFAALSANSPSSRSVLTHLATCGACRSLLDKLQEAGGSEVMCSNLPAPQLSDQALNMLSRQRRVMSLSLSQNTAEIKPGQVWALALPKPTTTSGSNLEKLARTFRDLSPIILVLRSFIRHATGHQVLDVVPITDEPTLAAEWSVVFPPAASGIEMPFVAHVDYQFTISPHHLSRYLGSISESAWLDLTELNRAWGQAETPVNDLSVGRMGQLTRREWPEWQQFDALWSELIATLQSEDSKDIEKCEGSDTIDGAKTFGPYLTCFVRNESFKDLHDWCSHQAQHTSPGIESKEQLWRVVDQISRLPRSIYQSTSWHVDIKLAIGTAVPPVVYKLVFQSMRQDATHNQRTIATLDRKAARHQEL